MRRVLGKWRGARPGGGGVTSSTVVGGTHGSRPTTTHFVGQGPRALPWGAGKNRSGRCGHRPLRKRNKRCNGRATARVAPTKALQGVRRGERNPPVTASPCQPPLGKGAKGTGDTDCHSQCAHWLRNDAFSRSAVQARAGGVKPRPYGDIVGDVGKEAPSHGFAVPAPFRQGG